LLLNQLDDEKNFRESRLWDSIEKIGVGSDSIVAEQYCIAEGVDT
jgi:hypothetical protein